MGLGFSVSEKRSMKKKMQRVFLCDSGWMLSIIVYTVHIYIKENDNRFLQLIKGRKKSEK
jgi:hypothetical protein